MMPRFTKPSSNAEHIGQPLAATNETSGSANTDLRRNALQEHIDVLIEQLRHGQEDVQLRSINALVAIGPAAAAAVPALTNALVGESWRVQSLALSALHTFGTLNGALDGAVQALRSALSHPRPSYRGLAAIHLRELGPIAGAAAQDLRIALEDKMEFVRREAEMALEFLGPAAVPALINALDPWRPVEQRDHALSSRMLGVLRRIQEAGPALIELLRATNPDVRRRAANGTKLVNFKEATPMLLEMVKNDMDEYVRATAIWAVMALNPLYPNVVAAVLKALRDPADNVRKSAIGVSSQLCFLCPSALSILIEAGRHEKNDEMRRAILEVVGYVAKQHKTSLATSRDKTEHAVKEVKTFLLETRSSDHSRVVRLQANIELADLLSEEEESTPSADASVSNLPALSPGDISENYKEIYVAFLTWQTCERGKNSFSCKVIARELNTKYGVKGNDETIRNYLTTVEELFQDHFGNPAFALFVRTRRAGFEFLPIEDDIKKAWTLIERIGRTVEALTGANGKLTKETDNR